MTAENLAKHRADPNAPFWAQLKQGADHFEVTKLEPTVGVCGKHYVFDAAPADPKLHFDASAPCPPLQTDQQLEAEVAAKQARDRTEVAELIAKGVKPVRIVYEDGGQHPDFRAHVADVSRPDAIAAGPHEIILDERTGKPVVDTASQAAPAKSDVPVAAAAASAPAEMTALARDTTGSLPAATKPATTDQPFYKRLFNFGAAPAPKPPPEPVADSPPSQAVPSDVPLPPRRQADVTKPQAALTSQKPVAGTKPTGVVAYTAQ